MVEVSAVEIRQCYDFANTAWNNRSQSVQQFGTAEERRRESFLADQIAGKLAEVVFKKEIEQNYAGVEVQLNFEHYLDRLHTDDGDVTILVNGEQLDERIDVKGSSHMAQWLLVEEHKYVDLQTREKMADRYVMVRFSSTMPTSQELRNNPEQILNLNSIEGEIVGWVNHEDFICPKDNATWFTFNRGDRLISAQVLPKSSSQISDLRHLGNYMNKVKQSKELADIHIGPRLDATLNVGMPIKWLNKDLTSLLNPAAIH